MDTILQLLTTKLWNLYKILLFKKYTNTNKLLIICICYLINIYTLPYIWAVLYIYK